MELYQAQDKEAALVHLHRLGVQYLLLPPWTWPTVQNSKITDIIKDPAMAQLVVEHAGYRLYRLVR